MIVSVLVFSTTITLSSKMKKEKADIPCIISSWVQNSLAVFSTFLGKSLAVPKGVLFGNYYSIQYLGQKNCPV
jgi:hypothetical protein